MLRADVIWHAPIAFGAALNGQAGVMLFRTCNINVLARAQYHMIFNSDYDHGPSCQLKPAARNKRIRIQTGWVTTAHFCRQNVSGNLDFPGKQPMLLHFSAIRR